MVALVISMLCPAGGSAGLSPQNNLGVQVNKKNVFTFLSAWGEFVARGEWFSGLCVGEPSVAAVRFLLVLLLSFFIQPHWPRPRLLSSKEPIITTPSPANVSVTYVTSTLTAVFIQHALCASPLSVVILSSRMGELRSLKHEMAQRLFNVRKNGGIFCRWRFFKWELSSLLCWL